MTYSNRMHSPTIKHLNLLLCRLEMFQSNTFCRPPFATILWFNVYYFHYMFRPRSVAIFRWFINTKYFLKVYFIFNGSVDILYLWITWRRQPIGAETCSGSNTHQTTILLRTEVYKVFDWYTCNRLHNPKVKIRNL
jgi:hypothetical protein